MTPFALPIDLRYPIDRAVGDDAHRLRRRLRGVAGSNSVALPNADERIDAALADADETPVRAAAIDYAHSFLSALPYAYQRSVDVQVDPEGEVVFEWMLSSRWILTLSINEQGRIAYSGIFGAARTRGRELFDGSLPDSIALAIARLRDCPPPL